MDESEGLVRAFFDAWAARDFALMAGHCAPDAEYPRSDGRAHGVDEIIDYFKQPSESFPDESATINALLVSPDGVTVEWTETCDGPARLARLLRPGSGEDRSRNQGGER